MDQSDKNLIAIYKLLNHTVELAVIAAFVLLIFIAVRWRTEKRNLLLRLLVIPVAVIAVVPLVQMGLWRGLIAPSVSAKMIAEQSKRELASSGPNVSPELLTVVGDMAPNLTFRDDGGEIVELKQLQGGVVLLNFFGIDCIPCIKELPELQKVHEEYSEQERFQMFTVSAFDTLDAVKKMKNDLNLTFPVCVADREQLVGWLSGTSIPQTYVIDSNGFIAYQHSGFDERHTHDTMLRLKQAVDEQLARPQETQLSNSE